MKPFFQYLSYVLRHKWFVFVECCRLGVPLRGLIHDLSKFRPSEWRDYQRYFYGPKLSGASWNADLQVVREAFDRAWLAHQHRNPHHWQHWVLHKDSGEVLVFEMPLAYRKEMLADWIGAGRAQGKVCAAGNVVGEPRHGPGKCLCETRQWYLAEVRKMRLGPETQAWVEMQLGIARPGMGADGANRALPTSGLLHCIYDSRETCIHPLWTSDCSCCSKRP